MKNEIKWTENQLAVINKKDSNLLISASAGSGKTATIIEKIIRLVLEGTNLESIVMLTFTNASAQDMKEKLKAAILKTIRNEKLQSKKRLLEQLEYITYSDIGTIDSFCIKIARKYFNYLELNPAFEILQDYEIVSIKNRALDNIIKKYSDEYNANFSSIYELFFNNRKDDMLKKSILNIDEYLDIQENSNDFIMRAKNTLQENFMGSKSEEYIIDYVKKYLSSYRNIILKEFKPFIVSENAKEVIEDMLFICEAVKNKSIYNLEILHEYELKALYKKKCKNDDDFLIEELQIFKKTFSIKFNNLKKFLINLDKLIFNYDRAKDATITLLDLVTEFRIEYESIKQKESKFNFSDIELFALKVLQNEEIKNELRDTYNFVFLDEYQDVNYVQDSIIKCISNSNLNVIGDVKQCIYAFRHAEPSIFLKRLELYNSNIDGTALHLNANFRSSRGVINFINLIFSNIMTKESAGISYKNDAMLVKLDDENLDADNYKNVQIVLLERKKSEQDTVDIEISDYENENELYITTTESDELNYDERDENLNIYSVKNDTQNSLNLDFAFRQASVIANLIEKAILELTVFHNGENRKAEYKDITLIARSSSKTVLDICEHLKFLNIPLKINLNTSIEPNIDTENIISMFRVLDNENQDIPLTNIMLSFFGEFTLEELALIKLDTAHEKFEYFYQRVAKRGYVKDDLGTKINNFYSKLSTLRNYSYNNCAYNVATKFLEDCNYLSYLTSCENKSERENTLLCFMQYLEENASAKNVSEFVFYYDNFIENMKINYSTENLNCVSLTNIHKSKGLEYPIVILIDFDKKFNFKDTTSGNNILIDNELGVALPFYTRSDFTYHETILQKAIGIKKKRENIQEEMRLLYVAMTRAKCHLFIVGGCEIEKFGKYSVDDISSNMDWLNNIAFKEKENLLKYVNYEDRTSDYCFSKEKSIPFVPKDIKKDNGLQDIEDIYNFEYPFIEDTFLSSKYTVTEILKYNFLENENYLYGEGILRKNNGSLVNDLIKDEYIERGIILHKIMQNIDFDIDNLDVLKEKILELIEFNYITPEDYKKIDVLDVWKCLNSTIIKKAKEGKCLKEKEFILNINASKVLNTKSNEKILLQGVIDLLSLGKENILIDYKASKRSLKNIKTAYKPQLELYKLAAEHILKIKIDKMYIYEFLKGNVIEIN